MASKTIKNLPVSEDNHDTKKDFYNELKHSRDANDLKLRIAKVTHRLGFSDYTFVPLERDRDYENQQGVLSTLPDEYWRLFREEELFTHDMLVSFFRETTHASHTSHIYNYYCNAPFENEITRTCRAIRQLQHSLGFYENYAIPIADGDNNDIYLFILSRQNADPAILQASTKGKTTQLRALGHAILKVCNNRFPTQLKRPPTKVVDIAPKPLRVLATLANSDMSINDVAKKLCISHITAHQQIAVARKALNRNTNNGAIKEAIRMGLIKFEYDN